MTNILFWYYVYTMNQKKGKKEVFKTNLRISRKLENAIKKAIKDTKRSLNGEIEFTLEEKYL